MSDDSEQEYEVEKIVAHKFSNRAIQYYVKWKGYSSDENTWEPQENLTNAQAKIDEYWERTKQKETPSQKNSNSSQKQKENSNQKQTKTQKQVKNQIKQVSPAAVQQIKPYIPVIPEKKIISIPKQIEIKEKEIKPIKQEQKEKEKEIKPINTSKPIKPILPNLIETKANPKQIEIKEKEIKPIKQEQKQTQNKESIIIPQPNYKIKFKIIASNHEKDLKWLVIEKDQKKIISNVEMKRNHLN